MIGSVIMGVALFVLKRRLTPSQEAYGIDYTQADDGEVAEVNITF